MGYAIACWLRHHKENYKELWRGYVQAGNPFWRGCISTADLLLLTRSGQLFLYISVYVSFYKTSYPNEEVNSTEPSPSVRFPWWIFF